MTSERLECTGCELEAYKIRYAVRHKCGPDQVELLDRLAGPIHSGFEAEHLDLYRRQAERLMAHSEQFVGRWADEPNHKVKFTDFTPLKPLEEFEL
jgi:hypothetical protein